MIVVGGCEVGGSVFPFSQKEPWCHPEPLRRKTWRLQSQEPQPTHRAQGWISSPGLRLGAGDGTSPHRSFFPFPSLSHTGSYYKAGLGGGGVRGEEEGR